MERSSREDAVGEPLANMYDTEKMTLLHQILNIHHNVHTNVANRRNVHVNLGARHSQLLLVSLQILPLQHQWDIYV